MNIDWTPNDQTPTSETPANEKPIIDKLINETLKRLVSIQGKHCEIEMAYHREAKVGHGSEFIDTFFASLPLLDYYNHIFTLCLPSACTDRDFVLIANQSK